MFARYVLLTLASLLLVSSASPQAAAQEERREPMLTVLGKGRYEVKPNLAQFRVAVSTTGKTLEAATEPHPERAARGSKVLQGLRGEGLEIEKSDFELKENWGTRPVASAQSGAGAKPERVLEGYTATTWFSLKTGSIDKLDHVVAKLVASNLFHIERVYYRVIQERAALNQARRDAMMDALEQARAYAEPVDLELEQIISVTDGSAEAPGGYADLPAPLQRGPFSLQIVPPAIVEFTASVNVTWRIAPRRAK